jgi:hypothetical protein
VRTHRHTYPEQLWLRHHGRYLHEGCRDTTKDEVDPDLRLAETKTWIHVEGTATRRGSEQTRILPGTNITQQGEILVDQSVKTGYASYITNNIQTRLSYRRLHLAQPRIPDEIGYMNFRYAIRMTAETHLLFHLLQDHLNDFMNGFWFRHNIQQSNSC